MMLNQYLKELQQDQFSCEEFIERLAWRAISETKKDGSDDFNSQLLHDTFEQAIKDLEILKKRQQKKCEQLEQEVRDEEKSYLSQVQSLQARNKETIETFGVLNGRISSVATRVVHLGEHLDSVNGPRSRADEAQKLISYLNMFVDHTGSTPSSPTSNCINDDFFTGKMSLKESADIIQKLQLIAQELPSPKFDNAKKKIERRYDEIERQLIEEFVAAQNVYDLDKMKQLASILSQFKGYSQCIDAFIEQSQMGSFSGKDIFSGLLPMCEKNYELMQLIFTNPNQVMSKFVLNIFHLKLQIYINNKLLSNEQQNPELYLKNLSELYLKTKQFCVDLSQLNMGIDENYLKKLTNNIFQKYLDNYISKELKFLNDKYNYLLQKYYESKNHQKKQIQTGGFQDLRRDLQAVIAQRANINIMQIENYGGETFISDELAINMLQQSKSAYQRCQLLMEKKSDVASNASEIFNKLINSLINEHVDYAIELALQNIPVMAYETTQGSTVGALVTGVSPLKQMPEIYFFNIIRQVNAIVHLFDKQFTDCLLPLIASTSKHDECMEKKKLILKQIEAKLDLGLDRSLNAIVGWVKTYLQNEQKKTDFKPDGEDFDILASSACKTVVQYLTSIIKQISDSLDGINRNQILEELGIRLHRVIYDHLLQFQYNSAGAMCVICDVNEYRRCVRSLGLLVERLFNALHSLCNLLLVKSENLQQVCDGEQLAELDRTVLLNFIQLRSDYKVQKLSLPFKS